MRTVSKKRASSHCGDVSATLQINVLKNVFDVFNTNNAAKKIVKVTDFVISEVKSELDLADTKMNEKLKLEKIPQLGLPPMELAERTNNVRNARGCSTNPFLQRVLGAVILLLITLGSYILLLTLLQYFDNSRTEIIIVTAPQVNSNLTLEKSNIEIHVQFKNKTSSGAKRAKRNVPDENVDVENNKDILNENDMKKARNMVMEYNVPCDKDNAFEICKDLVTKLRTINENEETEVSGKLLHPKMVENDSKRDIEELTPFTEKSRKQTQSMENIEKLKAVPQMPAMGKQSYVYVPPSVHSYPQHLHTSPIAADNCLLARLLKQHYPKPHSIYGSPPTDYLPTHYDSAPLYPRYAPATIPSSMFQGRDFDSAKGKLHPQDYEILQSVIGKSHQNDKQSMKLQSREAECPMGSLPCDSGDACINEHQWCDGNVDCLDVSDESRCSCRSRVDKSRLCDGYFDCPSGEDEMGCHGCSDSMFSCEDLTNSQSTCFSKEQRCNNIAECPNQRDEIDCTMLAPTLHKKPIFTVSNTEGFLHRNFKGEWYAVCKNPYMWAHDACRRETGLIIRPPFIEVLPIDPLLKVDYLSTGPGGAMETGNTCFNSSAIYVTCPDLLCGTRVMSTSQILEENLAAETQLFGRNKRQDQMYPYNLFYNVLNPKIPVPLSSDTEHNTVRGKRTESRVVGGKASQPAAWPWVVALYRDGTFHCGGSILTQSWVMSAAHCVHKFWEHYFEVQIGMLRRFSFSPQEQNRLVTHVIVNHKYNKVDMKNDVSLFKVKPTIQFSRWVRPICLPGPDTAGPNWVWGPTPGTICTAVGWGATEEHGPDPDHMREVEIPIWTKCKYKEDREGHEICAGLIEGGRDACQGDSGGPLLCRNPLNSQQWYMAGIVSHGDGCGRKDDPGVYTRVSLFVKWIRYHIFSKSLPTIQPKQECPGFKCVSGITKCLPIKRMCDKIVDCLDGEDEINCSSMRASSSFDNLFLTKPNKIHLKNRDAQTKEAQSSSSEESSSKEESHQPQVENISNESTNKLKELPKKESVISTESVTIQTTTETSRTTSLPNEKEESNIIDAKDNKGDLQHKTELDISTGSSDLTNKAVTSPSISMELLHKNEIDFSTARFEIKQESETSTLNNLESSTSKNDKNSFESSSVGSNEISTERKESEPQVRGDMQSIVTAISKESLESGSFISDTAISKESLESRSFSSENKESENSNEELNSKSLNGIKSTTSSEVHVDEDLNMNVNNQQNFDDADKMMIPNKDDNVSSHLSTILENEDTGNISATENHSKPLVSQVNETAHSKILNEENSNMESKDILIDLPDKPTVNNTPINTQDSPANSSTDAEAKHLNIGGESLVDKIKDIVASHLQPANKKHKYLIPDEFQCHRIPQTIPYSKRCDRRADCEDGTDELGCTCVNYLSRFESHLLCDGILDCADGRDEIDCYSCPKDQYLCKKSQFCLPNNYVCDGTPHCPQGEDELDCYALTNGQTIIYDYDSRPQVNLEGFLTKKHFDDWHVVCDNNLSIKQQEMAALHICRYLGFSSANRYLIKHINVKEGDIIQTRSANRNRRQTKEMPVHFAYRMMEEDKARHIVIKEPEVLKEHCVPNVTKTCQSLYVFCDQSLYNNFDVSNEIIFRSADSTTHMWPWVAKLYADGDYKCTGVLVDLSWVLVSHLCLWDTILTHQRVTAVLGSHRTLSTTKGMYEQTFQVDSMKDLYHNRVALLHLNRPAEYSSMVKPMIVPSATMQYETPSMCVAVGQDEKNHTVGLFLKETNENCYLHSKCYVRHQNMSDEVCAPDMKTNRQWAGIISCLSEQGWYPAASFVDSRGECGVDLKIIASEIGGLRNELKVHMDRAREAMNSNEVNEIDNCTGQRCGRGKCVKMQQVCDGVRHCEDGQDEDDDACTKKNRLCEKEPYNGGCECSTGQMKCLNGKCIAKELYRNGVDDCGDNSDEPAQMTCAHYLSRVEPARVCDGILHCKDRSDEDPIFCKCFAKKSFKCNKSYKNVEHCVAQDMVCDGINDCPNGEDEQVCIGLGAPQGYSHGKGQVIVRSHGVWFSKCYPAQNHTKSELEDICRQLGFISGHAKKIDLPQNAIYKFNNYLLDEFSNVELNDNTQIVIRNTEEPMATPILDESLKNCFPVFVECV